MLSTVAFGLAGALALVSLSACSPARSIGEPRSVDGGIEIVVPALWASGESQQGGIEPATVWVTTQRTSDQLAYEVNLSDVEAKGGGAMWQAATSSAAAIGTLFSGLNPDNIGYRFDITGPIDGPSAGAMLTVGALAALKQHRLDPETTMTGTISPDGSIGAVGLIPLKMNAAAEAGYARILIPAMLTTVSDPETGDPIDTELFGEELGLDVIFITSLPEAYEIFTGEQLFAVPNASAFSFEEFPELDKARTSGAESLQQFVRDQLAGQPEAPAAIAEDLAKAEGVTRGGDPSLGFAIAVDALDQLANWQGTREFEKNFDQLGRDAARAKLIESITGDLTVINQQVEDTIDASVDFSVSQSLALPGALGWLTYARAVLESILTELTNDPVGVGVTTLAEYSGLAQQVTDESRAVFPAVMTVLEATPASSGLPSQPVNSFLSGYTNFLVAAGDANLEYLQSVSGITPEVQSTFTVMQLVPVAAELGEEAEAIRPATEPVGVELEESSISMTYFVVTTSLVASFEVFGAPEMWLTVDEAVTAGNSYIEEAIIQSEELVLGMGAHLLESDVNAGFPVWSAAWGSDAFVEFASRGNAARGASVALNELWYDVITVLSMNAFTSPE